MFSRSCRNGVLLALVGASALFAGETTLEIDEAVRRGLESGEIRAESQKVEEARGRLRQSTARPNPSLVYDRQNIGDEGIAPGFVQDVVKVEQSFLGDRRRLARRNLGERGVEEAELGVAAARRRKIVTIRQAFVRALEAQEIVERHVAILGRVRQMQGIIESRVAAGESSRYEKARVGLAFSQEEDEVAAARHEAARTRTELASAMATSLPDSLDLRGSLLPSHLDPVIRSLEGDDAAGESEHAAATGVRPEIALERTRMETARAQEGVARSEQFAQLTAGLGYMAFEQTALPVQNGYNAILAVSLPIWDRKEGDIQSAKARARAAQHSLEALTARFAAEREGYRDQAEQARTRLRKLESTSKSQVDPLIEMAETSYQAGMVTLLELLDAYRLERDFQLQRIRARAALRQALENLAFSMLEDPLPFLEASFSARSGDVVKKKSHQEGHK